MSIRPLHGRLVLRPIMETTRESGLVMPGESADTKRGTVVHVGPGTYDNKGKFTETVVEVGSVVAYAKGSGEDHIFDGENLYFIPEDSILAVIEG